MTKSLPAQPWQVWRLAILEALEHAAVQGTDVFPPHREHIHRFRTCLKSARALLRMGPASLKVECKAWRQELSRIGKILSPIRDDHVFEDTLANLKKMPTLEPPKPLTQREQETLIGARLSLGTVITGLSHCADPSDDPESLMRAAKRCEKRAERLKPEDWTDTTSKAIHAYRSAFIVATYQAYFLNQMTGKPPRKSLKKRETYRNLLGRYNDLDQLIKTLKAKEPASRDDDTLLKKAKRKRKTIIKNLAAYL
jgi:CHAD domain-containing protein